ncbi:hypothetical protein BH23ACT11_BH23ACT11_21800 [soil metagenome]
MTASASCAANSAGNPPISNSEPVVLIVTEDLTWESVHDNPALKETFDEGAVANLSTTQGAAPQDPRIGYALLGAGSRIDSSLLPANLPNDPSDAVNAFGGPAAVIKPGSLGEAVSRAGLKTAAIGERAQLVAMDRAGKVPLFYSSAKPVSRLEEAISEGADLVVLQARSLGQAGRVVKAATKSGAVVAIVPIKASSGSANLAPVALRGAGEGLLYSPTTRTEGLIINSDIAPTLLAQLGVDPPPEMQGRAALVKPGSRESAARLGERLSFVPEHRNGVWVSIALIALLGLSLAGWRRGRIGVQPVLLIGASLPAGALASAVVPTTNVFAVVVATIFAAGTLAVLSWRLAGSVSGSIAAVYLITACVILADTATGGSLMKFSTLGYNPAYGTRFYGIGNEYAAFIAGSLTMGIGAFAHRRRLSPAPVLIIGLIAIVALGLPTMGADVGGSLALGLGFGATFGLLRGAGLRDLVVWTGAGAVPGAVLFLASGVLFPGVSHGSRAAGGETGLTDIIVRKLLLSMDLLLTPIYLVLLAAGLALVVVAWRRCKGTALATGLLGSTITAMASGALNDSGILAAIYALAFPAVAATIFLLSRTENTRRVI